MDRKSLFATVALGLSGLAAQAFPIAVSGTEGYSVIVAGSAPITATYEGNSASYSNDLYLERDALGNPGVDGIQSNDLFIFNNHSSAVGDTLNLGTFTPGVELVFRLHVNNTGDDFFSGPASRNADNHTHARVEDNWAPSVTLVSFEDLIGGPYDYNDLSFSFSNTRGTSSVPDPMSTNLWLGLSVVGAAWAARFRKIG